MIPKFRAWDSVKKEMFKDTFAITESGQVVVVEQENVVCHPDYVFVDHLVIMQSTGLFDKNGKEIFEEDVLEIQGVKMIVRFGSYKYIETSKSGNHTLGIMCDGLGFYVECLNVAAPDRISLFEPEILKESVVIGNIYENKEFLEEKE
nr:MAG TPA: YopX protein [Caudoviricetes sp.]